MRRYGYALTEWDDFRMSCLVGVSDYIDGCARRGRWSAPLDQLHDRLGFYGLGRN